MKNRNFLLMTFGLVVLTLLYVRSRFLIVELSYQVNEKMTEERKLEKLKRELNLELSVLQSPRRIEEIAKTKFHLKYGGDETSQKIFLKKKD